MITAILLSGGVGVRMQSPTPKQYLALSGKPIALHSFERLMSCFLINAITVVCEEKYDALFPSANHARPGKRRQDSLYHGLQTVCPQTQYILIHDAARPFVELEHIKAVIHEGITHGAATLATPVKETIKRANADHFVEETPLRSSLFAIQTPQLIQKDLLLKGCQKAYQENLTVTDDASLVEILGHPVKLVMGSDSNNKITTPYDLSIAHHVCQV